MARCLRWIASRPERLGLDSGRLADLVRQAEVFVDRDELPSAQIALACGGELALLCTLDGDGEGPGRAPAGNDSLYVAFSTTKAVTASAAWILIQEGLLRLDEPVADVIPEFAANDKSGVRLIDLLLHTAGFPRATFDALEWDDRERRLARFAGWKLEWEPGTRFQYHGLSGMWVVAALIEERTGIAFRDFVRTRIARPLGLERLHVGLPAECNDQVAEIVVIGEFPAAGRMEAAGLRLPEEIVGDPDTVLRFNRPEHRAVGVPGGGGIMNAGDLALFYQALLRDGRAPGGPEVWKPEMLAEARRVHTGELEDPMTRQRANRGLGLVIAGDESRIFRAFAPGNSPSAFGHPGMGGQVAWADPASGISWVFLSNGIDRNPLRMGARALSLSNLAAACARG